MKPLIFPRPGTQIQITLPAFFLSHASGRHGYRTLPLLNLYLVYVFFLTEFTRKSLPAPQKWCQGWNLFAISAWRVTGTKPKLPWSRRCTGWGSEAGRASCGCLMKLFKGCVCLEEEAIYSHSHKGLHPEAISEHFSTHGHPSVPACPASAVLTKLM